MAEVVKAHSRARLLFVGEYDHPHCLEHYQKLCALISELNLKEQVIWAGLRSDVDEVIRAFDICLLSTHAEGMPLVLLEAMAAGCPVIATRVGGIPELARPENSILVPPSEPEALARALRVLALEPPQVSLAHMELSFPPVERFLARFRAVLARRSRFDFEHELTGLTRLEQASAFLAVLELRKAGEIAIDQAAPLARIFVRRVEEKEAAWKNARSA
jgi:glycosyltransferase involved in cell wall biosynthesis